jgi:hypothetical protein
MDGFRGGIDAGEFAAEQSDGRAGTVVSLLVIEETRWKRVRWESSAAGSAFTQLAVDSCAVFVCSIHISGKLAIRQLTWTTGNPKRS